MNLINNLMPSNFNEEDFEKKNLKINYMKKNFKHGELMIRFMQKYILREYMLILLFLVLQL